MSTRQRTSTAKRTAQLELKADDAALKRGLSEVKTSLQGLARTNAETSAKMVSGWRAAGEAARGLQAGLALVSMAYHAVAGAVGGAVRGMADLASEANAQRAVLVQLSTTLAAHGIAWDDARESQDAYAAEIQRTIGVGDDATQALMNQIGQRTQGLQLEYDMIERLTTLTYDMARGTPASLDQVGAALSRLANNDVAGFNRIAPEMVDQLEAIQARGGGVEEMLSHLEGTFGGMRLQITDLTRDLGRVTNGWGDLREAIGDVILDAVTASGALGMAADNIDTMAGNIRDADSAMGQLVRSGLASVVSAATYAAQGVLRVVQGIQLMINALRVSAAMIVEMYNWASESGVLSGVATVLTGGVGGGLFGGGGGVDGDILREDTMAAIEQLTSSMQGMETIIGSLGEFRETVVPSLENATGTIEAATVAVDDATAANDRWSASLNRAADALDRLENKTNKAQPGVPLGTGKANRGLGRALGGAFGGGVDRVRQSLSGGFGSTVLDVFSGEEWKPEPKTTETPGPDVASTMADAFSSLPSMAASSLGMTLQAVGQFTMGVGDAFDKVAKQMVAAFGGACSTIGDAMLNSLLQGAISGTVSGGPLAIFGLVGTVANIAAGMLGAGSSGGASSARARVSTADVYTAMRPEGGGGGSTVHYHTNIGAYFGDPAADDYAARAVGAGIQRLIAVGEMPT